MQKQQYFENYVKILITTIMPYFIIILILIFFSIFANEFGIILYDIKDMRKDVLRSDK